MKIIKEIILLIITIAFLIPAAGFYYIKHTCLHSGNEHVVFLFKNDCCDSGKENQNCYGISEQQCCNTNNQTNSSEKIMINHEDCCVNEPNYLKNDSHYDIPERTIIEIPVCTNSFSYNIVQFHYPDFINKIPAFKPPPSISSLDILYQTGKLIL